MIMSLGSLFSNGGLRRHLMTNNRATARQESHNHKNNESSLVLVFFVGHAVLVGITAAYTYAVLTTTTTTTICPPSLVKRSSRREKDCEKDCDCTSCHRDTEDAMSSTDNNNNKIGPLASAALVFVANLPTRLHNLWRHSIMTPTQDFFHQRFLPLWKHVCYSLPRRLQRQYQLLLFHHHHHHDAPLSWQSLLVNNPSVAVITATTAVLVLGSLVMRSLGHCHHNHNPNNTPTVTRHSYRDPSTGYYHHQVLYRYPPTTSSSSSSTAAATGRHYPLFHLATWWGVTAAAGLLWWNHFVAWNENDNNSSDGDSHEISDDDDDDPTRKWPRPVAPSSTTTTTTRSPVLSASSCTASWQQQQEQQQQYAPKTRAATCRTQPNRYLEVLVHNVSHSDLILSLDIHNNNNNDNDDDKPTAPKLSTTPNHHHNNIEPSSDPYCLCRPRFSCFDMYTRLVLEALSSPSHLPQQQIQSYPGIVWAPRYHRALITPRLSIHKEPSDQVTPIGFQLVEEEEEETRNRKHNKNNNKNTSLQRRVSIPAQQIRADLRLRGRDLAKFEAALSRNNNSNNDMMMDISHVFFPLLATLLPRWHEHILEKQYHTAASTVHRVLVLVTGMGTPRNYTHSLWGNSTQALADLLQVFLRRIDPTLQVVHIHSTRNIFRYDENLIFVERELVPAVAAYRDAHARGWPYPTAQAIQKLLAQGRPRTLAELQEQQQQQPHCEGQNTTTPHDPEDHAFDTDWHKTFAVTLSFADGSPARNHAIQACLRPYRPTYFHFWQLKTFWHEAKIVDDDIEVHSFQAMETDPPTEADHCTDPWIVAVVQEMRLFLQEMTQTLASKQHDFDRFWLRKTHKPVLAVLLVQTAEMTEPVLYRGTNMEVSMPTGSLCAERNVIGSALAENPSLKRQDLKLIAVLAVPEMDHRHGTKDAGPSGSTVMPHVPSSSTIVDDSSCVSEQWRKGSIGSEQDAQQQQQLQLQQEPDGSRKTSFGSENDDRMDDGGGGGVRSDSTNGSRQNDNDDWVVPSDGDTSMEQQQQSVKTSDEGAATSAAAAEQGHNTTATLQNASTPLRRIHLFSKSAVAMRQQSSSQRRTVVVHSCKDLNPLKPCGACNEWLKKIAESNPYFRIITFTDANCNGMYVTPCQDY